MSEQVGKGRIHKQTVRYEHNLGYCASCDKSYPLADRKCLVDGSLLVALPSENDPMIGRVLDGRFEIKERIGQGGMGTVYRAFQASVSRDVALKIISNITPETVKRFMREARLSSRLAHPNTVTVHDFGQTHDGVVYLVMELIEGQTLTERLEANGPLTRSEFFDFSLQLCDAIASAHDTGIVHRDLKPCNVMIVALGHERHRIKVLDFGLAKSLNTETSRLSKGSIAMGTPAYMAPELIKNSPADKKSDLYALGCALYEMASGTPPFDGDSIEALFAEQLDKAPRPLSRTDLGTAPDIIMGLLSKDVNDRPDSVSLVRSKLSNAQSAERGTIPIAQTDLGFGLPTNALDSAPETTQHTWKRWLAAGTLVLGLGIAVTVLLRGSSQQDRANNKTLPTSKTRPNVTASPLSLPEDIASSVVGLHPTLSAPQSDLPPNSNNERPTHITLQLDSSPSAEVSMGDTVIGQTPTTHSTIRTKKLTNFRFRRSGYKTEIRSITPDNDQKIHVLLQRRSKRSTPREVAPTSTDPEPIFR